MKSVFTDKHKAPADDILKKALGKTFACWKEVIEFAHSSYSAAKDEWKFTGEKTGWSFRISDKKRVLVYMLPFENSFQVSMVFGQKAFEQIISFGIRQSIITELENARVYAEGRGLRILVKKSSQLKDIQQLIRIKVS